MQTRRIGRAAAPWHIGLLALVLAAPALADDVEFSIHADHLEVGTEDTFTVKITAAGAPGSAQIQVPSGDGLETLQSSSGVSRSISMGAGSAPVMKTVRTITLVMRATRPGVFRLPPALLITDDRTWRTESLRFIVKPGRVIPEARARRRDAQDPFAGLFPPGFLDPLADAFPVPQPREREVAPDFPGVRLPRQDSDVFMRTVVDSTRVTVGQQVTMSVWVFSRVELSSVDAVTLPKLEGFLSEEVDSPTQLSAQPRTIDGVPYRAYLLRRRALFPVKPGELTISAAEADITTGYLYAGERRHRSTRPITIQVDPLPPGAPPDMTSARVGRWKLSIDASRTVVELDQPFNVKVMLEGRGNLRNQTLPRLEAPADAFRLYEPTIGDELRTPRGQVEGQRTADYLVVPRRTGRFVLPPLRFPYFDPETGRYEVATTQPLELTVIPGKGSSAQAGAGGDTTRLAPDDADAVARNVLEGGGGVQPIRVHARFQGPVVPVWSRPWFWPVVVAPVGVWGLLALVGGLGARLRRTSLTDVRRSRTRAAHKRLLEAEKLKRSGSAQAYYAEVEKAVLGFLSAQLEEPVQGMTTEALEARLVAAGVSEEQRARVRDVLESCALARFAPGSAGGARARVLEEASTLMDGWSRS